MIKSDNFGFKLIPNSAWLNKRAKELGVKPTDVTEYKKVVKERDALEQRITKQKKEYK